MAGIFKFFDSIRFNFPNFFAFWIFNSCLGVWLIIMLSGNKFDSPHLAEIRTSCQNIMIAVVFYYYGASQNSKKKDDTIQQMIDQTKTKDDTIKTLSDASGKP